MTVNTNATLANALATLQEHEAAVGRFPKVCAHKDCEARAIWFTNDKRRWCDKHYIEYTTAEHAEVREWMYDHFHKHGLEG